MLITPTPRQLGYASCVWSWRLMHDNLFVFWSVCDVTTLCSYFQGSLLPSQDGWVMPDANDHEGWCMTNFSCIDRCVMYPSCVALSMLITPTPRWLGYAWCVWSWRLMHDNLFVYWSVCEVTILCSSFHFDNSNDKMAGLCLMRMIMKVDAW